MADDGQVGFDLEVEGDFPDLELDEVHDRVGAADGTIAQSTGAISVRVPLVEVRT